MAILEGAKVGAVKIAKQGRVDSGSVCRGRGVDGNKPSYRDEVKGRLTLESTCLHIKTVLLRVTSLDDHH